jgi:hypothetical protein
MKTSALSALGLLLAASGLRADPPGVAERIEKNGGEASRDPRTGQVTELELPPSATDADLAVLCELRGLRLLALDGTRLTDEGLRAVAGLPQVTELILFGGTFTDAGLRHLGAMRGLRRLTLWHCPNVTAEGVARLRMARPGVVRMCGRRRGPWLAAGRVGERS